MENVAKTNVTKVKSLIDYAGSKYCKSLTEQQVSVFVAAMLDKAEPVSYKDEIDSEPALRDSFAVQVLMKRGEATNIDFTMEVLIIVLTESDSPAKIVMWAATLWNIMQRDNTPIVTMDHLFKHFPMGLPKEETYDRVWTEQKGCNLQLARVDNAMDNPKYW
jgi:hypothetical protein